VLEGKAVKQQQGLVNAVTQKLTYIIPYRIIHHHHRWRNYYQSVNLTITHLQRNYIENGSCSRTK